MKPGNWLNNMLSIISLVSAGRLVRKRIWLGGALSTPPCPAAPVPGTPVPAFGFLDFFLASPGAFLGLSCNSNL